jgi:Tfp pilus assembly major pilin PilA
MSTYLEASGWTVLPAGEHAIRAISPMTLGLDGQHAAFFIAHPDESTFYLTDACETAMHASSYGIDLAAKRIDILNETPGVSLAHFDRDGAIVASGPNEQLQEALWDAVKLAMALSFQCAKWMPKFSQLRFRAQVGRALAAGVGVNRMVKGARAKGSSGHTADFAFAVRAASSTALTYIEPIALKAGKKMDWTQVYQTHGKMSDVKMADARNSRMVILEDGASAEEFKKAVTILEQSATVQTLAKTRDWREVFSG